MKLRATLSLLAAFVAGGAFVASLMLAFRPPPPLPGPLGQLELSREQHETIVGIMDRHRPELEATLEEVRPRLDAVRAEVREEILAELTPSQRARFLELEPDAPPPPLP